MRRHMQRTYEIVREFAEVFGQDEINGRLRGMYCDWTISASNFNDSLQWFEAVHGTGAASKYLYGMCPSAYFNYNETKSLPSGASVDQILAGYLNASGTIPSHTVETQQIAKAYGLKFAA